MASLIGALAYAQSPGQWREDIDFFANHIRENHPNPFFDMNPAQFQNELDALKAEAPELDRAQVLLRLQRIMALLKDGHSYMLFTQEPPVLSSFPLRFHVFNDGVYVINAMEQAADFVQAELIAIGETPVAKLQDLVLPFVSADNQPREDAFWIHQLSPELLHMLGVTSQTNSANVTLKLPDNTQKRVVLNAVPRKTYMDWNESLSPPPDAPLYLQRDDENYWMEYLPNENALYMKFRRVRSQRGAPTVMFSRDLMEAYDEHNAGLLIIDARLNGGGDGNLLRPLIERIADHDRINHRGRLYLITSPQTFSAATMLVMRMDRATNVLVAGEPSGGRPNHFGDAMEFALPNSGFKGRLSSLYHQESDPDDNRRMREVDIPVTLSSHDYFNRRDPVLEAVLADHRKRTAAQ